MIDHDLQLPTAHDSEQALLATLLFENPLIDTARAFLQSSDFFKTSHQLIFAAMLALFDREEVVTPVTLMEYLKCDGDLDRAGGPAYLSDFYSAHVRFTQAASLMPYITRIKEASIQRRIIRLSEQLQSQAQDREPVIGMIAAAERELESLRTSATVRQTDTIADVVDSVIRQIEEIQSSGEVPGLKTGFADLDRIIHGYQPGLLYILAAPSKEGKTTFALQSVLRASRDARNGQPVIGVLSLEMPKEKIALRLLQLASGIPDRTIYGKMSKDDWRAMSEAAAEVSQIKIKVADPERGVVEEVSAFIEELRRDFGRVDLLIVDFIQLMGSDEPDFTRKNRANQVDVIAYSLKRAAKRYELPIIALAQLKQEAAKRTERDASDLRDSDGIKQASDAILMLICKDLDAKENDQAIVPFELKVAANRYGRVGHFGLEFSSVIGAFGEVNL